MGASFARFQDGREERGDALVGADGLYSTVRAELFGEARDPATPATRPGAALPSPSTNSCPGGAGVNLWGRGSEFGLVNIGRERFYWYVTKNAPGGREEEPSGRKQEVLELLPGGTNPRGQPSRPPKRRRSCAPTSTTGSP